MNLMTRRLMLHMPTGRRSQSAGRTSLQVRSVHTVRGVQRQVGSYTYLRYKRLGSCCLLPGRGTSQRRRVKSSDSKAGRFHQGSNSMSSRG